MGIEIATSLALLTAANATPVVVAKLVGERWAWPLDFGCVLSDGARLLGDHKTWRGLVAGVLASTAAAALMQLPLWLGAAFAIASLIGDALSSALKRRMKMRPGTQCPWLDQLAEALLPLVLFAGPLSLDEGEIAVATVAFTMLDLAVARLRHRPWFQ